MAFAMKRFASLLMALALALTALPAAAFAQTKSINQRIADIESEYDLVVTCDGSVSEYIPEYLDDVEEALKILGPVFTKQALRYLWRKDRTFRLEIVAFPSTESRQWVDAQYYYDTEWDAEQVLSLYVKPQKRISTMTVIHEFGHMLHNCVGYNDFIEINGGQKSYRSPSFDANRYVSSYAMMDDCEDFAETFAHMVTNNQAAREHAASLSKNSTLYKKYIYILESIYTLCGANSRLTKTASDFLGVTIREKD